MCGVVKYPDGKGYPEATLADDDLYEVNPKYLRLFIDDANSVTYNVMLTNTEAVQLLHRTLGHVAVQRIEDLA